MRATGRGCDASPVEQADERDLATALNDAGSQAARVACCSASGLALAEVGRVLWVGGYIVGPDRAAGESPFAFGSDATVGLATVAQVGAELLGGVGALLPLGNRYAALALIRQLVEVEYLAWAFAEDEPEAASWLRSSPQERRRRWQPGHLRARSAGRFRSTDYGRHCEMGGHPTPDARRALPDHIDGFPTELCWYEATSHGVRIWEYVQAAAEKLGYGELLDGLSSTTSLAPAVARWRESDRLHVLFTGASTPFQL